MPKAPTRKKIPHQWEIPQQPLQYILFAPPQLQSTKIDSTLWHQRVVLININYLLKLLIFGK